MIGQILTNIFTSQVMKKAFTPSPSDTSSDLDVDVPAPDFKSYMRNLGNIRMAQGSKAVTAQAAQGAGRATSKYNQLLKQQLTG